MTEQNECCNDGCCGCCSHWSEWLYTVFRIIVGGLFLWHGIIKFTMGPAKLAGMLQVAPWLIWLAALIEVIGGALILLGLFTRYAAVAGFLDMAGAWLLFHVKHGGWSPMANGGEVPLLLLAAMLALFAYGAGRFALGNLFCRCGCDCEEHEHTETEAHVEALATPAEPKAARARASKSKKRK